MKDYIDEYYADKDLSLLKKLTLVIPTYNRNYYLSRCLWYHAHFPFGEIIVADSSPEEKKVVNCKTVQNIREMFGAKIRYLEYEPETEKYGEDIYRKWGDAVQHVETEYSKICTDKEFTIPKTIDHCIQYLDKHQDYSTADGSSLLISSSSNEKIQSTWEIWSPHDRTYELSDPVKRVMEAFETKQIQDGLGRWNMLTATRRTELQKQIYKKIVSYSLDDIRFGDNLPQLLSILYSKRIHFSDRPFIVRDVSKLINNNRTYELSESSYMRYPNIQEYIINGTIETKINNLSECISDCLKEIKQYNEYEISEYSNIICKNFLRLLGVEKYKLQKQIYSSKYLNTIYQKMPKNILKIGLRCAGIKATPEPLIKTSLPISVNNNIEMKIVERIIISTLEKHPKDSVVFSEKELQSN